MHHHRSITDCTNQLTTSTAIIVSRMVVYVALKMAVTTPTSSATITGHHLMRNALQPPGAGTTILGRGVRAVGGGNCPPGC